MQVRIVMRRTILSLSLHFFSEFGLCHDIKYKSMMHSEET